MKKAWMVNLALAGVLAPILAACASSTGQKSVFQPQCQHYVAVDDEEARWSQASILNVRIRQGSFSPMIARFEIDRPYIMRIENGDDRVRFFWAPAFFESIVAKDIVVADGAPGDGCVRGLEIPPKSVAVVRFVTQTDGRFEVSDTNLPQLPVQSSDGVMYINPPSHKIFER